MSFAQKTLYGANEAVAPAVDVLLSALDQSTEALVIVDGIVGPHHDPRIVYANRAVEGVIGCARDALTGVSFSRLFLDAQRAPLTELYAAMIAGRSMAFECELAGPDRAAITVALAFRRLIDHQDRPRSQWLVKLSEPDTSARILRALRDLRILQAAVTLIDDAVAVFDLGLGAEGVWTVAFVNPAFERTIGWQAGDLIGRDATVLFGSMQNADRRFVRKKLRLGQSACTELDLTSSTGEQVACDARFEPIADDTGVVRHAASVFRQLL